LRPAARPDRAWDHHGDSHSAILIGYAILAANRIFKLNPTMPLLDLWAAVWLPVYLVGMGVIVYLSGFGPLKN
jgi:hypothetical protein